MRFQENARIPSPSGAGAEGVGFAGSGAPLAELLALLGQGLWVVPAEARVGLVGVLKTWLEEHEGEVGHEPTKQRRWAPPAPFGRGSVGRCDK